MKNFDDLIKKFRLQLAETPLYSPAGKTFSCNNSEYSGTYWIYEGKDFYIDIHDMYIKEDYVFNESEILSNYLSLISNYIISCNGEWDTPYQNIGPNTILIMDVFRENNYIFHKNSIFYGVSLKFKENMLKKYVVESLQLKRDNVSHVFLSTRDTITEPIKKLANEILNCTMEKPAADLFFESIAKKWLSITINAFLESKNKKSVPLSDKKAIEKVCLYINDHYSMKIPQSLLEKIAMMSGTKLKSTFKKIHNMSITEYTQRKRINFAENLLMTSDIDIKNIAKAVGYSSPGRFSALYKRYKGQSPKDAKKNK